ncbi:MAG: HAD family hydrolase, partial [Bacillota bacterium]
MPYKLLALDLDGTLINEECRIPETTVAKLRQAKEKGVIVTLATGRMWVSTRTYANDLKLGHPLITYNGAVIKDAEGRETLYEKLVSSELVRDIISYCKTENLYLQLYGNDEIVVEKCVAETEIDPDLKFAACRELGDFNEYLAGPAAQTLAGS